MSVHPYTRLFVLPAPPDADNDVTEGYEIGDVVHVEGESVYDCRDNTEAAAVWEERVTGSSGIPMSYLDTDGTLAANSDAKVPSQKAVKTYVDTSVIGLLDFKGAIDCSSAPNYPAALKGDSYVVSVTGIIGGALGEAVQAGDLIIATADNAGGDEASVGTSWIVIEYTSKYSFVSCYRMHMVTTGGADACPISRRTYWRWIALGVVKDKVTNIITVKVVVDHVPCIVIGDKYPILNPARYHDGN